MNSINSFNHLAFPLFLFGAFLVFFSLMLADFPKKSQDHNVELEKFYETVCQNPNIELQLELIKTKSDFINTLVKIGSSLGYSFTVADVEESIQSFTNQTYTNHICLSIGCWKFG